MSLTDATLCPVTPRPPMPKSKAAKKRARKLHAQRLAGLTTPLSPARHAVVTRGRPKSDRDVGPTPQTVAKLKVDTLAMLRALKIDGKPFLSAELVEAGEEVLRTWGAITAAVDCRSGAGGYGSDADTERLQATWRRWCGLSKGQLPPDELYRQCLVRPSVIVDWLKDSASCDRDPKGAAGVLKRALEWWRQAKRDVARAAA